MQGVLKPFSNQGDYVRTFCLDICHVNIDIKTQQKLKSSNWMIVGGPDLQLWTL